MKKKTISQLKTKADQVFSLYIRNRDQGVCITCGIKKPVKEMQAGHFVSRRHLATRYDEWNVNCQCMQCNVFLKGNMVKYAKALMDKYGDNIVRELDEKSKKTAQLKRADYLAIIEAYENT